MLKSNRVSITLLTELYLKQEIISCIYSHIGLSSNLNNNLIGVKSTPSNKKKIYSFTYVPDYITIVVFNSIKWTEKIFPSVNGYAISIDDNLSVDDYLRQKNKKQRENINRALNRLETCFNVHYKMFQKNIEEEEYFFLMRHLKAMTIKRFEQRNQKSDSLTNWDKILSTSLALMKEGKASLFVIYDKDLPIAISFNYIYSKLLFGYISSYNIDYYKFSLGHLIIYKLFEWCLDNQYAQYDMGWGDLDYKKLWCNNIYSFNHHILYPKYSIIGFLYALKHGNKSKILAFLISKGVNKRFSRVKKKLKGNNRITQKRLSYKFKKLTPTQFEQLKGIDPLQKNLHITKQILNDFLFLTQERSSNVLLYYSQIENLYILKGKKEARAILFNQSNH
ncbi:GNAT family N-acetyltransferase [Croceitalea rosinachiae]|uniref:GNAT family N-acetyltransferase n=1 Tax=Croceitalea rosinachiae TaxID=3075596 RepID=A0ABU3ACD6_9FLAO|nr:GNAT family N-acetyltransferase [Croceitalea sp. F388]MDT0607854.1 GNAT family N-acetyltransferase [Croceitalea sp. F388]